MAFQDTQGNKFTNRPAMQSSEARNMAKTPAAAPEASPDPNQDQDVLQAPEVQQVFQVLAQAGVSPEEVTQAYSQVSGDSQEQAQPAPGGAM